VESLSRLPDAQAALAEAHRVVRPGGWLAVQDLFRAGRAGADIPGWRFADPEVYVEAIAAAGFIDIQVRDRTVEAAERAPRAIAARELLIARLRSDPRHTALAAEREALGHALAAGVLRVVQLVARRPA